MVRKYVVEEKKATRRKNYERRSAAWMSLEVKELLYRMVSLKVGEEVYG